MSDFNAEKYRHVMRRDLIPLVNDGTLDFEALLAIAKLVPQVGQEDNFFTNRVKRTLRYWFFAAKKRADLVDKIVLADRRIAEMNKEHAEYKGLIAYRERLYKQSKAEFGNIKTGCKGLLAHYEASTWWPFVNGWLGFGVTWDIRIDPPYNIYPLEESLAEKWDKIKAKSTVILEIAPDGSVKVNDPLKKKSKSKSKRKRNNTNKK